MISQEQVSLRIERLEQLSKKLAREIVVIAGAEDPLLYLERRAYLNGLQAALAGIEGARVVLAGARQRWSGSQQGVDGCGESPG
jgi:hypothetical protein